MFKIISIRINLKLGILMLVIKYRIKKQEYEKKFLIDNEFDKQNLLRFLNTILKEEDTEFLDIYLQKKCPHIIENYSGGITALPEKFRSHFNDFKLRLRDYKSNNY